MLKLRTLTTQTKKYKPEQPQKNKPLKRKECLKFMKKCVEESRKEKGRKEKKRQAENEQRL